MRTTESIVQPRIALARAAGNINEAEELSRLLRIAKSDSEAYITANQAKVNTLR